MNQITLRLTRNSELFGRAPQVGDKVFAHIVGTIASIHAEQIDLGAGETLNGDTFVTVLVQEVSPA